MNDSIHRYTVQYTGFCPIRCSLKWDCPSLSTRKYRNIIQKYKNRNFYCVIYLKCNTRTHKTICFYKASKAPLRTSCSCSVFYVSMCMWGNKSERWVTPRGEAVWSTHPSRSGCVAPSTCLHFAAEAVPHELMSLAVQQWDHNVLQWLSESCRNLTGIQLHHKLHPTFHLTNLTQLHHHRKNWLNFYRIESNLYV